MAGRSPDGSGRSPKGGAAKASPAKPSVPNAASRRRTFKPFDQAPRDGTPFHVPHIFRYNPFAKTFEALMRDQLSGELEWEPYPRLWQSRYYCDLLPLTFEPPKAFAVRFAARPAPRLTRWERLLSRLFGAPVDLAQKMMRYQWCASATEARRAGTAKQGPVHEGAVPKGDAQP